MKSRFHPTFETFDFPNIILLHVNLPDFVNYRNPTKLFSISLGNAEYKFIMLYIITCAGYDYFFANCTAYITPFFVFAILLINAFLILLGNIFLIHHARSYLSLTEGLLVGLI